MKKFKATEGRRVAQEIALIRAALSQRGYRLRKQPKQPVWTVYVSDDKSYLLTYQPAPISAWVLAPQDDETSRQTLLNIIQHTLTKQPTNITRRMS
ncbi:MAG: hypothetical protein F6K21_02265 [Symploca sp. SIO2D2]|nr:hypothetical protein [Symploca sp. SIO2D2]NER48589.1 hypothetical protein [Symploca sp. SIO1A3]